MHRSEMIRTPWVVVLPLLLFVCACEGEQGPSIRITDPWVRATPQGPGVNSAVYLVLENEGTLPDQLLGAETPLARAVEVHESRMEDGVMRMRPVESLALPGGERLELQPGGMHLMLVGLTRALSPGDTLDLALRFENAGVVSIRVPVRGIGGR